MTTPALERRLGPIDAAVIVVANVIGVGIFTTPLVVASIVPDSRTILGIWTAGGVLAFFGALAYAELAARRPRAGGEYEYLRESFGEVAAFLTGWTSFVAGFSGAIAAGAIGVTTYLDRFLPGTAGSKLIAIAIIAALALVHIRGLGPGRVVQTALTLLKIVALLGLVVSRLVLGDADPAPVFAPEPAPVSALLFAMVPVMFSYSGWNAAAYVAEEVREPARNVPPGLALRTGVVVGLY